MYLEFKVSSGDSIGMKTTEFLLFEEKYRKLHNMSIDSSNFLMILLEAGDFSTGFYLVKIFDLVVRVATKKLAVYLGVVLYLGIYVLSKYFAFFPL